MPLLKDIINMIKDIRSTSVAINLWGRALNIPQIAGGLIFIYTLEGSLVLIAEIAALLVASQIHKRSPFSRLMGMCHLPWLALAPWLLYRLQTVEHGPFLQAWLYYVAVTMCISLVFDVCDVYRYAKGAKIYRWSA